MQIIRNLNQSKITNSPSLALTIGNFDGLHLGHQKIIEEIKEIASNQNLKSAVLTFEPHPQSFFQKNKNENFRIYNLSQKLKIFQENKIDYFILLPFNQTLANVEANIFVEDFLIKKLNIKHLSIGYDFTFGKNRLGNFNLLEEKSRQFSFSLKQVPALTKDSNICSSTLIREMISKGNIKQANTLLGRNFNVSGIVNFGKQIARQLGFPTANILSLPHIIKPKYGVYKTITHILHLNQKFFSITNFGIKPTFNNSTTQELFETYIFDFSQNLYGKKITVEFVDFIREEKKFSSIEDLKNQIELDVAAAKK
ncbi:MAG: bifunctional riboflavin kinase/FAD synthetase [Pelagibacterales bacterium]|nr:bifunctional riboflavin kinase/FAD synthetase [Pelagibacterales bacterium]